jgi:hypothetical protein
MWPAANCLGGEEFELMGTGAPKSTSAAGFPDEVKRAEAEGGSGRRELASVSNLSLRDGPHLGGLQRYHRRGLAGRRCKAYRARLVRRKYITSATKH